MSSNLHPVFNKDNPPEPVHYSKTADFLIHDEDFNRAVQQFTDDADHIYRQLSSLEDNNPLKESLEEAMLEKINQNWPAELEGITSFSGVMQQAENIYQNAHDSINDLEITYGFTGLATTAAFGLSLFGILGPLSVLATSAVAAGSTFAASSAFGGIREVNKQVDIMEQAASCMHAARDEFDVIWSRSMQEDSDHNDEVE